jgi:hypothetical protein
MKPTTDIGIFNPGTMEAAADLAHEIWCDWTRYMFSKCSENADGSVTIPKEFVETWLRQMAAPYGRTIWPHHMLSWMKKRNNLIGMWPCGGCT